MSARSVSAMPALLLLAACVSGPEAVGSIDTKSFASARVVIDPRVADEIPRSEQSELLRALAPTAPGSGKPVRILPSFSFRPAAMAVVADESGQGDAANHRASKAKDWLGSKRWQGRYSVTLIDGAGKTVGAYAVSHIVGKRGEQAARRACFSRLIFDLASQNR